MPYVIVTLLLALSACSREPTSSVHSNDAVIDSPANAGLDSANAQNDERKAAAGLKRQPTTSDR